jgi:hypothetical protein
MTKLSCSILPASILVLLSNLDAASAGTMGQNPTGALGNRAPGAGSATSPVGSALSGAPAGSASSTSASTPGPGAGTAPSPGGTSSVPSQSSLPPDAIGPNIQDGFECECVESYVNGEDVRVWTCDYYYERCMPAPELVDCQDNLSAPECNYLLSCECDCAALEQTVEFEHEASDDIMLTGALDLYQFPYLCDGSGANWVGCGSVAAAMLVYWWSGLGYTSLTDDCNVLAFNNYSGNDGAEVHDWQSLVRKLRDRYLPSICIPIGDQTAVLPERLGPGIAQYFRDAGYSATVDHVRVCDDCNVNGYDEVLGAEGIGLIKGELAAGRPVIIGFNSKKARTSQMTLTYSDAEGTPYTAPLYTGEMSNGVGWIDHYALITGYRKLDVGHVITMNLGFGTDENFLWNPTGKWVNLYKVNVSEAPDGEPWCSVDLGFAGFTPYDVDFSNSGYALATETNLFAPLAGTSCGVALQGEWVEYYDTKHELNICPTPGDLPDDDATDLDQFDRGTNDFSDDERGVVDEVGTNVPILDQLGPR